MQQEHGLDVHGGGRHFPPTASGENYESVREHAVPLITSITVIPDSAMQIVPGR